jgi:hypothetical protein
VSDRDGERERERERERESRLNIKWERATLPMVSLIQKVFQRFYSPNTSFIPHSFPPQLHLDKSLHKSRYTQTSTTLNRTNIERTCCVQENSTQLW